MIHTGNVAHGSRLLFVINEAYFFMSHRLPVARAAQEAGYEVHVAAPDDHVWAPDDFSVDQLAREGFVYHRIPLSRRGTNPFGELRTFIAIMALFLRLRPDIVHLLTIKPVLYGGIAARLCRVPAMVAAVTGLGQIFVASGLRSGLLRRLVVSGYRFVSGHPNCRVIVQNSGDLEVLADRQAVRRSRLVLIRGSGVDLEAFRSHLQTDEKPLVLLPARLLWEKGVGEFVEAARRLKAKGISARFALVGDTNATNPRAVPASMLQAWHSEGVIEWWGRRDDMPEVLASAHIVCLPTIYGEGVPKALIEAAACGRPIVASDIPGCREIVHDGANGMLVAPGNTDALCDALARLIGDADLRAAMGCRGQKLAEESFSDRQVAVQTLQVYQELQAAHK
jgi:glycosyltransferase involved in cell wall biosynthesis